jgi:flagellum-specific ATP synthase/type III secretion protein N (ATPase)
VALPEHLQSLIRSGAGENRPVGQGQIRGLLGVSVEVVGIRAASGDLCTIHSAGKDIPAEVVGFREGVTMVMPLGEMSGIAPLDEVTHHGRPLTVTTGNALLGRVVDALGRPIDGGPPLLGVDRPVVAMAPRALSRQPITEAVPTGVAAIDGFLTCGRGQRIGIFAGSGVGKSTLLGMIARDGTADVNVIALIGERGREVRDFLEQVLGPEGLKRSVVVVATSDSPPMLRFKGPFTAVTIAETFRAQGLNVMFTMDSVTRFAGAAREIGLAAGEPPTLRGYPPSLFAHLPRLVERMGNDGQGSITGLLTVLVEGDDLSEPVSDAMRGYLDGHIVLSRQIAARGRFPAVDILSSVSRLMPNVASVTHLECAQKLRELLAHYEENRDLVQVGAYRKGSDPLLDRAMDKIEAIEDLLYHGHGSRSFDATLEALQQLATNGLPGSIISHGMADE